MIISPTIHSNAHETVENLQENKTSFGCINSQLTLIFYPAVFKIAVLMEIILHKFGIEMVLLS